MPAGGETALPQIRPGTGTGSIPALAVDAAPPRSRRTRKPRPRKEVVSAPPGFGGLDGSRTFGGALADAMLSVGELSAIPGWWPLDRLPGLRGTGVRQSLDTACKEFLGKPVSEVLACSTDASPQGLVEDVVSFVRSCGPVVRATWPGVGEMAIHTGTCMGVGVLILESPARTVVVAPPWSLPSAP